MLGTLTLMFEDDWEESQYSSDVFEMNACRLTAGEVEFQLDETSSLFRRLERLMRSSEVRYLTFVFDCTKEGSIYKFLEAYPAWMDRYEEPGAVGLAFLDYEVYTAKDDQCHTE